MREDGKARAFVEKVVCFLLYVFFGIKVPDANAPFRLMKANVVKKYLCRLPSDYGLPNIMLTVYYAYYKEKLDFIEISFKPRQGGTSSLDIVKIIKIGMRTLYDFWIFRKDMVQE